MTLPDLSSGQWSLTVSESLDAETVFTQLFTRQIVLVEARMNGHPDTWQAAGWMYQEVQGGLDQVMVDSNFISLARKTVCYWQLTAQDYYLRYVPVQWTRPQTINIWEWTG